MSAPTIEELRSMSDEQLINMTIATLGNLYLAFKLLH